MMKNLSLLLIILCLQSCISVCIVANRIKINKDYFRREDRGEYLRPDSTSYLLYYFNRDTVGRPIAVKSYFLFGGGSVFSNSYRFGGVIEDTSSYRFVPLWKTLRSANGTIQEQETEILNGLDSAMWAYSPYSRAGNGKWAYHGDTLEIRRAASIVQCRYAVYIHKFLVKSDTLVPLSRGRKNKPTDSENVEGIFYKRQKVQSVN